MSKKRIAIIGGGTAGLTAAYQLNKAHDISLFEKSARLGGNAYNYTTHDGEKVDIAAAVFGTAGYPNFYALLEELGLKSSLCVRSFMTFYDLDQKQGLSVTPTWKGLRMQNFELLKPKNMGHFWRVSRGLARARKMAKRGELDGLTLEQCLDQISEFEGEGRIIVLCALCLLSSMSGPEVLATPALFFIRKLEVHHDVLDRKSTRLNSSH